MPEAGDTSLTRKPEPTASGPIMPPMGGSIGVHIDTGISFSLQCLEMLQHTTALP